MSTRITITNSNSEDSKVNVLVVSQKHSDDGREMHVNGRDIVAPGASSDFLISEKESILIKEEGAVSDE
jgi:actin-like ATPase involved in cell morphogenesis